MRLKLRAKTTSGLILRAGARLNLKLQTVIPLELKIRTRIPLLINKPRPLINKTPLLLKSQAFKPLK
jgi:hypothetical protein